MSRFRTLTIVAIGLAALSFGAARAVADSSFSASTKEVKVGVILPLSGDASVWGTNPQHGLTLAIEDLKHSTGKKPAIALTFEDDRCDPKTAVTAFHKLVDEDGVKVILGPACSSSVSALAPLLKGRDILLIPFAEAPFEGVGDRILRLWIPSDRQAKILAQYMFTSAGIRHPAILAVDNAFGNGTAKAFRETFTALGGTAAASDTYQADLRDFSSPLTKVRSAKPDALFVASYVADGATLFTQARRLGLTQPFFGTSTINTQPFFAQCGSAADGITIADVVDRTDAGFRERWTSRFHEPWPGLQSGAPLFYDLFHLLVEGQSALSSGVAFRDFLLHHAPYHGVTGELAFDTSGDLTLKHTVHVSRAGVFTPLPDQTQQK